MVDIILIKAGEAAETTLSQSGACTFQRTLDEARPHAGADTIERGTRHDRTQDGVRQKV